MCFSEDGREVVLLSPNCVSDATDLTRRQVTSNIDDLEHVRIKPAGAQFEDVWFAHPVLEETGVTYYLHIIFDHAGDQQDDYLAPGTAGDHVVEAFHAYNNRRIAHTFQGRDTVAAMNDAISANLPFARASRPAVIDRCSAARPAAALDTCKEDRRRLAPRVPGEDDASRIRKVSGVRIPRVKPGAYISDAQSDSSIDGDEKDALPPAGKAHFAKAAAAAAAAGPDGH
eukprot:gene290-4826_t